MHLEKSLAYGIRLEDLVRIKVELIVTEYFVVSYRQALWTTEYKVLSSADESLDPCQGKILVRTSTPLNFRAPAYLQRATSSANRCKFSEPEQSCDAHELSMDAAWDEDGYIMLDRAYRLAYRLAGTSQLSRPSCTPEPSRLWG